MTRKAAVNRMIHWQTAAIGRKVSPDSLVRYDGSRTLPAQSFRGRNDRIITAKLWKPLCRFNGKSTGIRYVNLVFFFFYQILDYIFPFIVRFKSGGGKIWFPSRFSRKGESRDSFRLANTIDKLLDKEKRWKKRWTTRTRIRMKLAWVVQRYWTRTLSTDSVELAGSHATIMRTRIINFC